MANVEKNCCWHFAPQLGGREDGPNDPMQENFKKTPYASLIRESIQNSLDVVLDKSQPVIMKFSIGHFDANNFPNFFELRRHIEGCIEHFVDNSDAARTYQPMIDYFKGLGKYDKLYYIKVSDYNTTGMEYEKGNTKVPFYAFVRAAGVSSKSDVSAGGSFGYGKAAYFYISPIRTIMVSTKTDSGNLYFEGVSSLCTHNLTGSKDLFVSVGYYDNNDGEPISVEEEIPARFKRDEPGTDIYILGIDASDKKAIYQEMIEAVLRNFWLTIYKNKLEVWIDNNAITSENIVSIMEEYFPDEPDNKPKSRNYNPRYYLEAVSKARCDNNHIVIEETYPTIGKIMLYAIKHKKAIDKVLYMRKPLMLVKAERTKSSNGFLGVCVCEDQKGNEILRQTENPAHNEWSASNWRENRKIVQKGKDAIKEVEEFIITAMERMFSNKNKDVQTIHGLEEFLYIPTAVEEDEGENESLVGNIIGDGSNEENALTTDLSDISISRKNDDTAIGKVLIVNPRPSPHTKDDRGSKLSGHGKRHKKTTGGGGVTSGKIDSRYNESDDGVSGTFLYEIPVRYRSFAQIEFGKVVHNIIIHSDYETSNGRIDLLICGEQSDETVDILSCTPLAVINKNSISGIHILKGKNIIKVIFADNMKHAIKLDAYELK